MKIRDEIANKLYEDCRELIQPPPDLQEVKIALLDICAKVAQTRAAGKEHLKEVPEDQREAFIAGYNTAIQDDFNVITKGYAESLNHEKKEPNEKLLSAVRTRALSYINAWKGVDPAEIRRRCEDEITAICSAARKEEKDITTPENLGAVFPGKSRLPNNELERQLLNGIINDGEADIIFSGKGRADEVSATMRVTRPIQAEGLTVYGEYSTYDAEISRGVDDIFMDPNCDNFFSLPQLYRTIIHNKEGKLTNSEKKKMFNSLEAQRVTKGAGDIRKVKEAARKKGINVDRLPDNMDRMLLSLTGGTKIIDGEEQPYYHIDQRPLPSLFGQLTKQQIVISADCYYIREVDAAGTIGQSVANSPARIAIKGYLIRRIEAMKNDLRLAKDAFRKYEERRQKNKKMQEKELSDFQRMQHIILFETVFEVSGVSDCTRATITRHKEYIKKCLIYWRAIAEIKDFRMIEGSRKNSYDRAEIILE